MSEPVGWMADDGRLTSAATKEGMPASVLPSFHIPLCRADELERKDAAIAELLAALKDAKEMLLRWGCSVPEYSAQKRGLASDVAKLDAAIAKAEL